METPAPDPFLNARELLERSQPVRRNAWLGYGIGFFVAMVLVSTIVSAQSAAMQDVVRVMSMLMLLGIMAAMGAIFFFTARSHQNELRQIEAIEELIQLRRWPQAALLLSDALSRPMRTPQARFQALLYLTAVLARYHKFEDAQLVQDHLLEHELDARTEYGLRLGRAMAMLRQDHLFDADRAISDLRRASGEDRSAGLALVEMYRDVKTGHPAEAIEVFEKSRAALREQLGHRVADAHALHSAALDLLGRSAEAQEAYSKATTLSDPSELARRYPELGKLAAKYSPMPVPQEVLA